jgi:O-acetyl-ADP-ribose deacetylase (regulator of RNase III)
MEIEIRNADPIDYVGDGLVLPTNSYGQMVEGLAARIKDEFGEAIEKEAIQSAPIAVGAAVITGGGSLSVSKIIHVPVVDHPGLRIGIENVRRATRAGLLAANHVQLESICIPGFGYGENGIPYDETARAIIDEIRAFKGSCPTSVVLADMDRTMVQAFKAQVEDR